jgi:hypothetical protein
MQQWIFDSVDLPPRLLKFRSGHYSPPHLIRHYGEDGKQLLTAAQDRSLRCTSVVRDSRSFELSQGIPFYFIPLLELTRSRISFEESDIFVYTHFIPQVPSCQFHILLYLEIKRLG